MFLSLKAIHLSLLAIHLSFYVPYVDSDDEAPSIENQASKMKLIATTTVQGYVSALKNYYSNEGVSWPDDLKEALNEFVAGHQRDNMYLLK